MMVLKLIYTYIIRVKDRLWDFIDAFNDDRVHVAKPRDILQRYLDLKVDDINEFAAIYTYEYHERRSILDNRKSKAAMYKQVYEIMKMLEEKGSLTHDDH